MPGRSPVDLLIYESKRRPEIRALMELAETGELTDAQLDAAKVPLPWYRKALRQLRDARLANRRMNVSMGNTMKSMEEHGLIKDGKLAPSEGIMAYYYGPTQFIQMGRGQIELLEGRPVFYPKVGGVWIDTVFSGHIDPKLENWCSRPVHCDRAHYIATWKDMLQGVVRTAGADVQQIGEDAAIAETHPGVPVHLAKAGVRFS